MTKKSSIVADPGRHLPHEKTLQPSASDHRTPEKSHPYHRQGQTLGMVNRKEGQILKQLSTMMNTAKMR